MTKRYANTALIYAITAMILGVFYREFTKLNGFSGVTRLSVMHTHYFMLGMFFFLILMLLEKNFPFSNQKHTGKMVVIYHVGLNITGFGLFFRGITQVLGTTLSRGLDASISGISGIGHILLGISIIYLLLQIKKQAA